MNFILLHLNCIWAVHKARDIVAYLANSWLTEIDSKTETEQDIDVYLNETRTFNEIFDRFFSILMYFYLLFPENWWTSAQQRIQLQFDLIIPLA